MIKNYKIDNYKEWIRAYRRSKIKSLEECKLMFYNKEHCTAYGPQLLLDYRELSEIKTYTDAILHKNSKNFRINEICKFILKGDIEIYD